MGNQQTRQRMLAELQYVVDALNRQSDANAIHSLAYVVDYMDHNEGTHLRECVKHLP